MSEQALEPAREQEVTRLAAAIDLKDPGTILRFGAAAQSRAQAAADAMLEGAQNRETGEAGATLSSMLSALRGFDVTTLAEKPNFFQRLFTKAGAEVTAITQRYEGVRDQVEAIGDKLDSHRTKLLEDVERLERLYVATLDWFHALADHIAAGERVLTRTDAEVIPALEAEATKDTADPLAPQALRDARAARDELERIQENDKALAAKIQSVLANTVPLWRQQLAQALAIHRMRDAGAAVKAATDLTNKLLTANAETLRKGNAEARRELERGTFDIEAVKQANAALVGTIEDSLRIADEAKAQRRSAEAELAKCEQEIRRALTAARAREGSSAARA